MQEIGQLDARENKLKGLLELGLTGDEPAYRAFLQELSAHLRAFFRRRLAGLPDEVEDLVQEALLAIHLKRHTYDARVPLTPWIHAIAKYKLIDFLRRRSRSDLLNDPLDDLLDLATEPDTEAADARRDLGKLLARLPERQRLPLIYTKLEGLSVAEASERSGMSESAVKVGVHRGLKALAAIIREER